MKNHYLTFKCLAIIQAAVLFVCGSAHAQTVIYQDQFSGSGALNGSSPTMASGLDGGTSGVTWNASLWTEDGTEATITDSDNPGSNAFLPFTPEAGFIYNLTGVLNSSSEDWVALGFTDGTDTADAWHTVNNPTDWLLYKGSDAVSGFGGPGTGNNTFNGTATSSGMFDITLDTTGSNWTYSYSGPGVSSSTYMFSSNPSISEVGFGQFEGGTFSVGNFELTASAAPEPSSYILLVAGLCTLMFLSRKIRSITSST